jgi:hypothetical protein
MYWNGPGFMFQHKHILFVSVCLFFSSRALMKRLVRQNHRNWTQLKTFRANKWPCLTETSQRKLQISCRVAGRRGSVRMLVGFTTTYAISVFRHESCEFESSAWRGVLDKTCDKVCQWLATGRWFSSGTPVSSFNKIDHHDITDILLKVALSTIKQTNKQILFEWWMSTNTL